MGKNDVTLVMDSGTAKVTVLKSSSRALFWFCRIVGIALIVLGLLLALAVPPVGIAFAALGVIFFVKLSKVKKTKVVSISSPRYTGGPTFGEWNAAVHKGIPQMERYERATHQDMELLDYNDETGFGRLRGSSGSVYVTSLDACSCEDFDKRSRPCKHIYFLAVKMGYSGDDFYM